MSHCGQRSGAVGAKCSLGRKCNVVANPHQTRDPAGEEGPKRRYESDRPSNVREMIRAIRRVGAREVTVGNGPGGVDGFYGINSGWPPQYSDEPYEHSGSDYPADDTPSGRQWTVQRCGDIPEEHSVAVT
jgi:hypothetical protein